MEIQKEVTLVNKFSESERLSKIIEDFAEGKNFSLKFLFEIDVALDEILTNIISYAYNDKAEHKILVRLFFLEDGLKIQIKDKGIAFNPLEKAEPDITKSVMERPIGGLGIHMVRKLVDELKYKRENNKNILTLIKKDNKNGGSR